MTARHEWAFLAAQLTSAGKTRAEIAATLRERFGLGALAAIRHAHGWSQHDAAKEWTRRWPTVPKTYKDFSGWETGRHTPSLDVFDKLAEMYSCDLVDVLADRRGYRDRDKTRGRADQSRCSDPTSAEPRSVPASGSVLAATTSSWFLLHSATNVLTILDMLGSRGELVEPSTERLEAIHSRRVGVDKETLDGLALVTLGYRQAYRSVGASSLLSPAYGSLNVLMELAPDASEEQRPALVSMIGQMGALIGTLLMLDLGDYDAARPYLAIAVRAGQQIEDDELLAFALGCRAFHSAYSGHLDDGVGFADSALNVAERGIAPRTHGWLAAVASEMHATVHGTKRCEQLLDVAAAQLETIEPNQQWLGIGVFNADKLTAYRGGDLVRLGRYGEAQAELHRALDRLDPSLKKHRATACVDLADAYVKEGKLDDGAEHAIAALNIVAGTGHADTLRRVDVLHRKLKASGTSTVRRLTERLLEMKAAAAS